jgi:hypothetical protein
MANCTNCGSPLAEGQAFCPSCGQPVGAAAVAQTAPGAPPMAQAAAPTPPPAPPPYQQAPPAYTPPPAYGPPPGYPPGGYQPPRKSRMGLWIGLGALIIVIVVACVLVFAVFKDQIFGGGASGPEQAVQKFLTVMEKKDVDGFFDLIDPASLEEFTSMGMSLDAIKPLLASEMFSYDSIKFNNVKMETEDNGDGTATVRIVEGSVTIVEDGDTTTEDVQESGEPVEFEVLKQDGKWYINPETMF